MTWWREKMSIHWLMFYLAKTVPASSSFLNLWTQLFGAVLLNNSFLLLWVASASAVTDAIHLCLSKTLNLPTVRGNVQCKMCLDVFMCTSNFFVAKIPPVQASTRLRFEQLVLFLATPNTLYVPYMSVIVSFWSIFRDLKQESQLYCRHVPGRSFTETTSSFHIGHQMVFQACAGLDWFWTIDLEWKYFISLANPLSLLASHPCGHYF